MIEAYREGLEHIAEEQLEMVGQMAQTIGLEMLSHSSELYNTAINLKMLFVGDVVLEASASNHGAFHRWSYYLVCKEKPQSFSDSFKLNDILALASQFGRGEHWVDDSVGTWKKYGHNSFIKSYFL